MPLCVCVSLHTVLRNETKQANKMADPPMSVGFVGWLASDANGDAVTVTLRTDRRTDGQTDRRTDGRTDTTKGTIIR